MSTRSSDPGTFALAERTVAVMNAATAWIPESGAQMDWIAAVRLGWNSTELILKAGQVGAPTLRWPPARLMVVQRLSWFVRAGSRGFCRFPLGGQALGPTSRYPMYPNLYGTDGGGGLETCGVTLAINEMLLQVCAPVGLNSAPVQAHAKPQPLLPLHRHASPMARVVTGCPPAMHSQAKARCGFSRSGQPTGRPPSPTCGPTEGFSSLRSTPAPRRPQH